MKCKIEIKDENKEAIEAAAPLGSTARTMGKAIKRQIDCRFRAWVRLSARPVTAPTVDHDQDVIH